MKKFEPTFEDFANAHRNAMILLAVIQEIHEVFGPNPNPDALDEMLRNIRDEDIQRLKKAMMR